MNKRRISLGPSIAAQNATMDRLLRRMKVPQQQTEHVTFADACRGFAAMIRSGALKPEDHEMVAKKFTDAATLIEELTKRAYPTDASDPAYGAGFRAARELAADCVSKAREGERDGDFRSILYFINSLTPGS